MDDMTKGSHSLERMQERCDRGTISARQGDLHLKYLRYLCHDMNNNLGGIALELQEIKQHLQARSECNAEIAALDAARETIERTSAGMRELLRREQGRRRHAPAGERFDLHGLVETVVRQFAAQAQRRGIRVISDVPREASVDSSGVLIALALQNLISNAVKYGVPGTVRVAARQPGGGSGCWELSVSDEGPGIPQEQVSRIFACDERGNTDGEPGFGLGLAIVSDVARQLGGRVSVDSRVGAGSTFYLALPAEAPPA